MDNLEDPAIRGIIDSGYGCELRPPLICDGCGDDIGDYIYEPEAELLLCEDCFSQRMEDYLSLYPREVADAMGIPWYSNE